MALPPRVFFTLHEAAARWGCNIADVAGWAAIGKFRILTGIGPVRCGQEIVAGQVVISPMDLIPMFRRCGSGPSEGVMKRLQPPGREDWLLITDPAGGIPVAVADMLILAGEVQAFEEDNDIVRRVNAGPGATSPYNWEGMMVALVQRIHERGVPTTQAELVADMQDWFADQSDGAKIPDGRTVRRRIVPIWKVLRGEEA
jgi:hypothetical protein